MDGIRRTPNHVDMTYLNERLQALKTTQARCYIEPDRIEDDLPYARVRDSTRTSLQLERQ